jgi:hypothetical protein
MTSALYKYRLWCQTESNYVYSWNSEPPISCANNTGHSIDSNSVTVIDQINRNVTFLQGYTNSGNNTLTVPVDEEGRLITHFPESAFGEMLTADASPVIQTCFVYTINTEQVSTNALGIGSVSHSNNFALINSGAASNSSAQMMTRRFLKYKSGQGARVLFTTIFSPGVEGSYQLAGLGNNENGFFFGYNGTDFGIVRRSNGLDYWTPQTSWNIDKMDGGGVSGMILDPTKGNVYQIKFQWLGFGAINFYVEETNSGRFQCVHRIKYANTNVQTTIAYPSLPMTIMAINTTNTTNITIKSPSMAAFIEGKKEQLGPKYSMHNAKTISIPSTSSTYTILSLKNKPTYCGKTNMVPVFLHTLCAGATATNMIIISIIRDPTFSTTPSWTNISLNNSVVQYDTIVSTVTGGTEVYSFPITDKNIQTLNVSNLDMFFIPGETIAITAKFTKSSTSDVIVTISWIEDH